MNLFSPIDSPESEQGESKLNWKVDLSALYQVFRSPDLRRLLPELGLASFLTNMLGLALPLAILQIMDRVVINKSLETLFYLILGILVALVFEQVLRIISSHVTGWLGARFEHNASVATL